MSALYATGCYELRKPSQPSGVPKCIRVCNHIYLTVTYANNCMLLPGILNYDAFLHCSHLGMYMLLHTYTLLFILYSW